MKMYLPTGGRDQDGNGEVPGTYVYIVDGDEITAYTAKPWATFPIGDRDSSAYGLEVLRDPDLFVEVDLDQAPEESDE